MLRCLVVQNVVWYKFSISPDASGNRDEGGTLVTNYRAKVNLTCRVSSFDICGISVTQPCVVFLGRERLGFLGGMQPRICTPLWLFAYVTLRG